MISRRRLLTSGMALGSVTFVSSAFGLSLSSATRPRVVVVGAGFGGSTLARYLNQLADVDITVIDPDKQFITCPFSNLVITGERDLQSITFGRAGIAQAGISFLETSVIALDLEKRQVRLQDGASLAYDYLICAPGVAFNYSAIDGVNEDTVNVMPHAWKAGDQTLRLASQLQQMKPGGVFLIAAPPNPYRCPPGPYERAGLIAQWCQTRNPKAKVLVVDQKDQFTKKDLFVEGWQARYGDMVEWVGVSNTGQLRAVNANKMQIETDFDNFKADVINLIPPQRAPDLLRDSGLDAGTNWCQVHPDTFESKVVNNVFVIGDAANAAPMPKSAFSANNQAKLVAAVIAARVTGKDQPQAWLANTCYSLVATDYGISISGVYEPKSGELQTVSGGQSPLGDKPDLRRQEAVYTYGWYDAITRDSFGPTDV